MKASSAKPSEPAETIAPGTGTTAEETDGQAQSAVSPDSLNLDPSLVIPPVVRLAEPAGGVPHVIDTPAGLQNAAERLAHEQGPTGLDTERASSIRYGNRPFLVQIKRGDSPIFLIDPEAFEDLSLIDEALAGSEWILHASTQDLPSLKMVGMTPSALFDTELAGRLAGIPRVSLGAMTEELLGYALAKEHSAADWSQRPLPQSWLAYAALDVELLLDLREAVLEILREQGKLGWALEEFDAIRRAPDPAPKTDPWRKTKGIHQLRSVRQRTALRNLWYIRESLAQSKDIAPKRLLPDSALISAAKAMPRTVPALHRIPGFHAKLIKRESVRWVRAISQAASDDDPVRFTVPSDTPPPVKAWETKKPESAAVLKPVKEAVAGLAEELGLPSENLVTPEHLRRLCWESPRADAEQIEELLAGYGSRPWQIELAVPVIAPVMAG